MQENGEVLRIGSYFGIEFGHRDVSDHQLLPSLFFVRPEYVVNVRPIKETTTELYCIGIPRLDVTLPSYPQQC